jgi:hypothetical protein
MHSAARNYTATGPLAAAGMPQERLARIAARQAFVQMKTAFMEAVAHLDGEPGRWLQHQVRQAQEPVDLWLLRGAVFRALREEDEAEEQRLRLNRCLDSVFPRSSRFSPF